MKIRKVIRTGVSIFLVIALVVGVIAWRRATRQPEWWTKSLTARDETALEEVGAGVESAFTSELTRERAPTDPWSIEVTEQEASAWLTGRLPLWLANRDAVVPADWQRTGIVFRDGELEIAAEVRPAGSSTRYVGLVIVPEITPDGGLHLRAAAATLGRLRTPFSVIADRLLPRFKKMAERAGESDSDSLQVVDEFIATHGMTITPAEFELDDGRRVRVTGIEVLPGKLRLTLQTSRPARTGQRQRPR